jgi:hypothetical protein
MSWCEDSGVKAASLTVFQRAWIAFRALAFRHKTEFSDCDYCSQLKASIAASDIICSPSGVDIKCCCFIRFTHCPVVPPPSSDLLESSSKRLGANVDCGRIKLPWPGHFTKQSPNETFSLHNVIYVAPQAVKFLM